MINNVVSWVLCMGLLVAFALSLFIQSTEAEFVGNLPSLCVVKSASMSYREEKNEYLFANDLQDQFDTFDIIFLSPLPDEYELKLYDIVVYEAKDGTRIVHRIVGIEEPNAEHPGCRYFRLQGDAVQVSDKYPVLYTQMRGIYSGERIRFVGSFVMFMQSPAGYICILLVLLAIVSTPIVEKRIEKEKQKRLAAMEAPSKEADHA
ncbi:MAG: hypothetical protein IJY12_05085 [Clostridia bacterium]|nr:hypothetical protein [Clostridia bacterium]